MTNWSYFW